MPLLKSENSLLAVVSTAMLLTPCSLKWETSFLAISKDFVGLR